MDSTHSKTSPTRERGLRELMLSVPRSRVGLVLSGVFLTLLCASLHAAHASADDTLFRERVAPIFEKHCIRCHNADEHKGGLSLATAEAVRKGGESGAVLVPSQPDASLLIQYVTGDKPEMPKKAPPLSAPQVAALREWIAAGATWPADITLKDKQFEGQVWWSLRPLVRPAVPDVRKLFARGSGETETRGQGDKGTRGQGDKGNRALSSLVPVSPDPLVVPSLSPIDAFILAKLDEHGLSLSPEADRRTLYRRLSFDLLGLPPDPDEVDAFVVDPDPLAYQRLVDSMLASPRYGERWARHWLDVVHYGDTHGYDKDKLRPNAWPYRDYVVRSLNEDKPYDRFVLEQLAGDVLWPETVDGFTATGFIAAGPWDFIGHAEVPESKIDGKIARNLDRDDMVTTAMNTFCSLTVQCARCHNHKFDPVTQTDYYRLQANFAALDRADRMFDADPAVSHRRGELLAEQQRHKGEEQRLTSEVAKLCGEELKSLDQKIASAQSAVAGQRRPEYGYHSGIESSQDKTKWVQVDLGKEVAMESLALVGCWDDFNNIGEGFGFPVRFKVELSSDADFKSNVIVALDRTSEDVPNPGTKRWTIDLKRQTPSKPATTSSSSSGSRLSALDSRPKEPLTLALSPQSRGEGTKPEEKTTPVARYVRVTATKLAPRLNDFILALAELSLFDAEGQNVALGATVTALDSIEAPVRWSRKNLVDGLFTGQSVDDVNQLREQRVALLNRLVPQALRDEMNRVAAGLSETAGHLAALPAPQYVFAGMIHTGGGTFSGTGPFGGKPRSIHVLKRGDVTSPGDEVGPGIVPLRPGESGEFALAPNHVEGDRRVALARWIVDEQHPLTWRSLVNRVWQHHFGRGIVDSPNDFGRMGQLPSHLELLDWLAVEFRDGGRSLKPLHRLIVTSATYRQRSTISEPTAGETDPSSNQQSKIKNPQSIDSGNVLLWRANRRKLDAEALRDGLLFVAGKLDDRMGGPAFQDFVIEKPEHSPHYEYQLHDPEDPRSHRRSIYRFLVRSQTQPFMTTLDCADPSMIVDKRNETVTALQALALLNNKLVLSMSRHTASRVEAAAPDERQRVALAFRLAIGRSPTADEVEALSDYARQHGLTQACRVILNLNEFAFVD